MDTPALLPTDAPADWNRPFLNAVVAGQSEHDAESWRTATRQIETELGRDRASAISSWAPRVIDIDLLGWCEAGPGRRPLLRSDLPPQRAFELVPLLHLQPDLRLNARPQLSLQQQTRSHSLPLWMGIVNLTPDSFSDGGRHGSLNDVRRSVQTMTEAGAQIIDFGAESTRPGATPLSAEDEWQRLQPALQVALDTTRDDPLRPRFSVDTYHPATAARALQLGVEMINDVGGLCDPAMRELAAAHPDRDWVAMHQLGLPADAAVTVLDPDPFDQIERWLLTQMEHWQAAGISLDRVIFDPGIGFAKDGVQSLRLLRRVGELRRHGLRLLVGHSRKSYMRHFSRLDNDDKDLVTVGASLALACQGVDILRVHNVAAHAAAYRGWAHLQPPPALGRPTPP